MEVFRKITFVLLSVILLVSSGCGGGNSGSSGVFGTSGTTTPTTPTTPTNTSGDNKPQFALVVDTNIKSVDVDKNIGTVLATAILRNQSGADVVIDSAGTTIKTGDAVGNQPITFTVLAGPASVDFTTPQTDVNGNATAIITTQDTSSTTNVLIEAKTTLLGVTYRAYTSIQIVRGTGEIAIPAPRPPITDAPGLLPTLDKTVNPVLASGWCWNQLIPFKVTDSNSNARVGVPVTLSVYSQSGSSTITIDFHAPTVTEPSAATVTTDSAGQGIFNVDICMTTPPAGLTVVDSVVYKAVTSDTIPITAYVGQEYTLTSALPILTLSPPSALFGSSTSITLAIAGGLPPYNVTSSDSNRVSITRSDTTVTATLVDVTPWTGAVTITVTDSAGQTASSSLTR